MMLIEQSVAPLQFVRLEQSHLQAVQDDLILGAGHPKFFAHAPKLEKSEGACPANRVYAFPLNYLHSVMDWRWGKSFKNASPPSLVKKASSCPQKMIVLGCRSRRNICHAAY